MHCLQQGVWRNWGVSESDGSAVDKERQSIVMEHFKTKIIEFFGLPKTGKTTTVDALVKSLNKDGFNVSKVHERASVCPIKDKLHPSFNYWTTVSFMKEYLEANEKGYDYLIADRGILDAYIWVYLLSKKIQNTNFITRFENLINQSFVLEKYLLAFSYKAKYNVIMSREKERTMKKFRNGRIMNEEILDLYNSTYEEINPKLKIISNIVELDTTNKDIPQMLFAVSEYIDNLMLK